MDKSIALLEKLQTILPRPTLPTIYKAPTLILVAPYMTKHAMILFINTIQYNADFAITGTIRGTSLENLYQELGLDSLQQRYWYHKSFNFLKIIKEKSLEYLFDIIPKNNLIIEQEILTSHNLLQNTTSSRILFFFHQ